MWESRVSSNEGGVADPLTPLICIVVKEIPSILRGRRRLPQPANPLRAVLLTSSCIPERRSQATEALDHYSARKGGVEKYSYSLPPPLIPSSSLLLLRRLAESAALSLALRPSTTAKRGVITEKLKKEKLQAADHSHIVVHSDFVLLIDLLKSLSVTLPLLGVRTEGLSPSFLTGLRRRMSMTKRR